MVVDSASLVIFAIRAGLKLAQESKEAYVDATKRHEVVLPLPNFDTTPSDLDAFYFFTGEGRDYIELSKRLKELMEKRNTQTKWTDEEKKEAVAFYREFYPLYSTKAGKVPTLQDGTRLTAEQLNAVITIRQWRPGHDPNPSVLHRFAGTFVELGIDYFTTVPGAINTETKYGKLIHSFLSSLGNIDFSEEKLSNLPGRLFMATLETASENSELFSGDKKVQELVGVTARGLVEDIAKKIEKIRAEGGENLALEQRVTEWAEVVFRSLLSSGGRMVLEDPGRFLGVKKEGQKALITHVGGAVLDLLLEQPPGELDKVFGKKGVEKILKAALGAVGEHPEIIHTNNLGLQHLLSEVALQLSQYDTLLTKDMLPELMRLILEKTGKNLDLFWPDIAKEPQKHLLLTALSTVLGLLAKKPAPGEGWTPKFSQSDLMGLANIVFDELVQNPGWLIDVSGKMNENLKIALEAALTVLRSRADNRLSIETAVEVLHEALKAVALRAEFLDKMEPGAAKAGRAVIEEALDVVLGTIFDPTLDLRVTWRLVRREVIAGTVRIGLKGLVETKPSPQNVKVLRSYMNNQVNLIALGKPWDMNLFESGLHQALAQA